MSESTNHPISRMLSTKECAELLGVSVGTLSYWRMQGRGPAYTKTGNKRNCKVRYSMEDIEVWVAAHRAATEVPGNPYCGR